jgi:anti-sigma regulatory factor (Ser/Thr protein kinase)
MATKKFYITYSLDEVSCFLQRIELLLQEFAIDRQRILKVQLVLEELLANIINHNSVENDRIEIEVDIKGIEMRIRVKDKGGYFNLNQYDNKPDYAAAKKREYIEGCGVFIVKNIVKSLTYLRNKNTNIVDIVL